MSKPVAVVIGDIHFTLNTLEQASAALKQAVALAEELNVPLIINGDTLDTKAVMRAECVNAFLPCLRSRTSLYVNVGNHDMVNEKGEQHALEFLYAYANVIEQPTALDDLLVIPYQSNPDTLREIVRQSPAKTLIVHQGLYGADMGHYVTDKTSIRPEDFAGRRVIASHYHKSQDIPLPGGGLWSYIGNPYTLSFGEAKDPAKGFVVLRDDGTLEHVDTNLRKHLSIDWRVGTEWTNYEYEPGDIVRVRVSGPQSDLATFDKVALSGCVFHSAPYRLDLVPDKADTVELDAIEATDTAADVLDKLIDALPDSGEHKEKLKLMWRVINAD